jgi:hypothetical protein
MRFTVSLACALNDFTAMPGGHCRVHCHPMSTPIVDPLVVEELRASTADSVAQIGPMEYSFVCAYPHAPTST